MHSTAQGQEVLTSVTARAPLLFDLSPSRFLSFVLLAGGSAALALTFLIDYLPGGAPGFGQAQMLALTFGMLAAAAGAGLRLPTAQLLPASWIEFTAQRIDALIRFAPAAAEVGAVVLILRWFHLENPAFYDQIVPLTFGGFVVHHLLPRRLRLGFFVLLSLTAILLVFGRAGGAWLIGLGLTLIAICHLPLAFRARVALLIGAGILLATLRAQLLLPAQVPEAIWPIFGSMFMFRLILYVYELRHAREPMGVRRTAAYFFMLPNIAFPLFPVVDFATFRRTYYDRDDLQIYRAGVRWMLIGITHLLLYRIVYQYMTLPAAEVASGAQLARHMGATFLLYLKVSGQFHLIVGMLHLFGFRLPESHRFFYLASSFTDLWRRINIYWKDFMAKVFYYPVFFRLRTQGDTFALVLSTLLVFFATWALHSYQWFWLLGSVLLSWPDALFWGILAAVLVVNSLWENRRGRIRRLGTGLPEPRESLRLGFAVAGTFTTMCVLWSLWSSHTLRDWIALWRAAQIGPAAIAVAGSSFVGAALLIAAGHQLLARMKRTRGQAARSAPPSFALNATWLLAFCMLGSPVLMPRLNLAAQQFTRDLRVDKLNRADAQLLHRGYYENLTGVNQFNSRLWEAYAKKPSSWKYLPNTEAMRPTGDFRRWELVPLIGFAYNGVTLRTNRWGMRDIDYELTPPAGTYRIALGGSSFVMGSGVNDHETFEQLVEDRLNNEVAGGSAGRYEILNFAVPSFSPAQQAFLVESKVVQFNPAAVMIVGHPYDTYSSSAHTARMFLQGVAMPHPYVEDMVIRAGLTRSMTLDEATQRLLQPPFKHDLVRWSLERIAAVCREHGIQPVWLFATTPDVDVPENEIALMFDAARNAGFIVVDISDAYGDVDSRLIRLAPWDAHPNALGHGMISDRLYRALVAEGLLARLRAGQNSAPE